MCVAKCPPTPGAAASNNDGVVEIGVAIAVAPKWCPVRVLLGSEGEEQPKCLDDAAIRTDGAHDEWNPGGQACPQPGRQAPTCDCAVPDHDEKTAR